MNTPKTAQAWLDKHGAEASAVLKSVRCYWCRNGLPYIPGMGSQETEDGSGPWHGDVDGDWDNPKTWHECEAGSDDFLPRFAPSIATVLWAYGEQVRGETYDAVLTALDRFRSAAQARMGHTHMDDTYALRDAFLGLIDWIKAQRDRR